MSELYKVTIERTSTREDTVAEWLPAGTGKGEKITGSEMRRDYDTITHRKTVKVTETIYQQTFDSVDVMAVILAANEADHG